MGRCQTGVCECDLFDKSFPSLTFSFPASLIPRTLGPFNVFILLNVGICLHGVLD